MTYIEQVEADQSSANIIRRNVIEFEKLMARTPKLDLNEIPKIDDYSKHPVVGQVDLRVEHYFSKGVYARELHIPKGIILTGKIHKYSQLNILIKGKIEVVIDAKLQTIEAPYVVVSLPGTKRIARALEDCVWITIHGTEETDITKIEQQFIAQSEQEYLDHCGQEPELPFRMPTNILTG